jgi:hypothetical protein
MQCLTEIEKVAQQGKPENENGSKVIYESKIRVDSNRK